MYSRDYKDIVGGALLMLLGAGAALYAWIQYPAGTIRSMGPGMFPVALGVLLFILGVLIFTPALLRNGAELPPFELRPLIAISAAGLAFALCIERFGIVPAVLALTIVSACGDTKLTWKGTFALAIGMALGATIIFKLALDLPVHIARWPF